MATTSLQSRIDALDTKLDTKFDELTKAVMKMEGNVPTRAEMAAQMATRVSTERFDGDTAAMRDRLSRLEGGPQKLLGWISLIVSAVVGLGAFGIGCLSLLFVALTIIITVAIAIVPHLH